MTLSGWLILDKPVDMTSACAVGIVKRKLRQVTGEKIKIGHTGTLDPFATGVLPLALGEATKLSQFFLDCFKAYDFTLKWGEKTTTADLTGDIIQKSDILPDMNDIIACIKHFCGAQQQVPPKFSALKVNGQRAYDLARNNIEFSLNKRDIFIQNLELTHHNPQNQETSFRVTCSKGTYVRTLGEDIAKALGSVGHLVALKRTKVGFFSLQDAISPDISEEMMYKAILDIASPLDGIPAIIVDADQAQALRFGQAIPWHSATPNCEIFPAIDDMMHPVALVSLKQGAIAPKRVFNF